MRSNMTTGYPEEPSFIVRMKNLSYILTKKKKRRKKKEKKKKRVF